MKNLILPLLLLCPHFALANIQMAVEVEVPQDQIVAYGSVVQASDKDSMIILDCDSKLGGPGMDLTIINRKSTNTTYSKIKYNEIPEAQCLAVRDAIADVKVNKEKSVKFELTRTSITLVP